MKYSNILFIVEGLKTERAIITQLSSIFNFKANIYSVNANIYAIYQAVRNDPFANIIKVVSEMSNSESDNTILNKKFTDVFLVFDCDAHHTTNKQEAQELSIQEIALRNINIVIEMAKHFNESTDPEKGKLLVNYPMIESFRDCDDFFDINYSDAYVSIDDIGNYKQIVSTKKLAGKHIKDFTEANFIDLMKMNIFKLNKIINGNFTALDYSNFYLDSNQCTISKHQANLIKTNDIISILNTLIFFPIEYFGNKNKFYENIVNPTNEFRTNKSPIGI